VRRVASADARRLKRILPQNAEHGVVEELRASTTFSVLPWVPPPPPTGSDAKGVGSITLSVDHLAVVRLRTMIAQEAEAERARAHGVTLKKTIEDPVAGASAGGNRNEKERGQNCQGNPWRHMCSVGIVPDEGEVNRASAW